MLLQRQGAKLELRPPPGTSLSAGLCGVAAVKDPCFATWLKHSVGFLRYGIITEGEKEAGKDIIRTVRVG